MWDHYYKLRIFLVVQKIRLYGWWHNKPSLWQYSWRQIACCAIGMQLAKDRNKGIEPSSENLKLLREMEKEYNVEPYKM